MATLEDAEWSALDTHFAQLLTRLAGHDDPALALAASLASRATANGDVCVHLADYVGSGDVAEAGDPFTLRVPRSASLSANGGTVRAEEANRCRLEARTADPRVESWLDTLRASPLVGRPGDFRPLDPRRTRPSLSLPLLGLRAASRGESARTRSRCRRRGRSAAARGPRTSLPRQRRRGPETRRRDGRAAPPVRDLRRAGHREDHDGRQDPCPARGAGARASAGDRSRRADRQGRRARAGRHPRGRSTRSRSIER